MAAITTTLETAVTPPLELELLEEPGTGGGGTAPWWGRLLKPRLTIAMPPLGSRQLAPYGQPGPWTRGAFIVAAVLAALVVLACVGLYHLVRGR